MEKKNDDMRKYFQRKCNRWDSCRQILLVEKRIEVLEHEGCAREHRKYQKRDISYWEQGKSLVAKNAEFGDGNCLITWPFSRVIKHF